MTTALTSGETDDAWLRMAYPALDLSEGPLKGSPLADLAEGSHPHWPALLTWQQQIAPGVDARAEAALFLGQALFFLTISLLQPSFDGGDPRAAEPDACSVQLTPLEGEGEGGGVSRCVHLQCTAWQAGSGTMPVLENLARPLILGLSRRTGLGQPALWRVAADGIALGLLDLGRKRNDVALAGRLFHSVLKRPGSPFTNRHLCWPVDAAAGILQRGGCCRIYQSGTHPLCPGCVLQAKKKSRDPGHGSP